MWISTDTLFELLYNHMCYIYNDLLHALMLCVVTGHLTGISHWSQVYLTPSCAEALCLLSLAAIVKNLELHWSQGYLTLSCADVLCWQRLPWSVYCLLHILQLNWLSLTEIKFKFIYCHKSQLGQYSFMQ